MKLLRCADTLHPRLNAAAAPLRDGRVLVVGGATGRAGDAAPVAACEIYDPARDAWTEAPPLRVPRQDVAVTTLHDGRVLAIGGRGADRAPLAAVESWAPGQPAWTREPDLDEPVWGARVAVVDDRRALVIGGFAPGGPTRGAASVDVETGAIAVAPATRFPHANHAVATFGDGTPLVAGIRVERLDGDAWREVGGFLGGDADATALASLPDGRILMAGGRAVEDADAPVSETVVFTRAANGAEPATRFRGPARWALTLAVVGDEVIAVGGLADHRSPRCVDAWEAWTPGGGWSRLGAGEPRFLHVQVTLPDRSVVVIGGVEADAGRPGTAATRRVTRLVPG